ncbi:hypothetical protein [Aeromonas phage 4L372D]|uniref:Uncharacterized protein n=2 Tax=Plateaulakevirus TaxID=2843436 RepID=A0A5B9NBA6_9CAUD|nr:hypothetical protein HWC25_gp003 [Aeromonas phage 2L372D]YP_009846785.1 hypothetical protein HWC27_gp154 [Aeromonas phage 4L372D]QDB73917.1 hypothetical protein 2L372D_003 [Aeromonas phage 2L372D]QEG08701.1 hypothetical protein [Aeromonas phage 4L372D]
MDREQFITNSCKSFREIQNIPFGKERRTQLLLWLQTQTKEMSWHIPYGFIVNKRHQLIVNKDPDLQYLIKKGILIQINKLLTLRTSYNYLVLADKYNKNGTLK